MNVKSPESVKSETITVRLTESQHTHLEGMVREERAKSRSAAILLLIDQDREVREIERDVMNSP